MPPFCRPRPTKRGHDAGVRTRSEEHTSELQSHSDLVCRLLLEKKNKRKTITCRSGKTEICLIFFLSFIYLRPTPLSFFFFFNDTATTEIYTLSLHDALPISA